MKQMLMMVALAVTLIGCAQNPQRAAMQEEFYRTIPTCSSAEDCNAKWEAAQLWVVHNAAYKIQTVSNVMIETYNPTNASARIGARVTKEPVGGGKYKLVVSIWCDNIFGCVPDSLDTAIRFNKEIAAVTQ